MTSVRPELPEMPPRIAALPVHRGYPVPWFVAWRDGDDPTPVGEGEPDFRLMRDGAVAEAYRLQRCWVCGGRLGSNRAFVVGPMCAVNRVSAEPPSHVECAEWSARACPFLTRPTMRRREAGIPGTAVEPPGVALMRNPGVALVWVTRKFTRRQVPGGVLFDMGDPERVSWWCEGRDATRAEVEQSIRTGLPALAEMAAAQGPFAQRALNAQIARTSALLPGGPDLRSMEAVCPDCGCADVDLAFSDDPIVDGVKCWECGAVYPLGPSTGRDLTPAA